MGGSPAWRTQRARNFVQDMPAQFADVDVVQRGKKGGQVFDRKWLEGNQLVVEGLTVASEEMVAGVEVRRQVRGSPRRSAATQPQAPQIVQQQMKDKAPMPQSGSGTRGRKQRRGGSVDQLAALYQKKLEQQRDEQTVVGGDAMDASYGVAYQEAGRGYLQAGLVPTSALPSDTGLASLPVELPVRGTVYLFTTPRGEVEIAARAVSVRFVETVVRLGAVLVVLVIGGIGLWLVRSGRGAALGGRNGAILLVLLGVGSAALGVLPIAGLALALVGLVLLIRRRRAAPAAVAA